MNNADRIAMLEKLPGTYCNFAGGKCGYNNTKDCPKKSILKHCRTLRDYYRSVPKESRDEPSTASNP